MRRLSLIIPVTLLVPLMLSGCHQTTATTSAPALSPVGAGQAPTLSPFGGPTKVSPPPTGSYSAPNTYMGAPPQAGPPMGTTTFPPQSNNNIGSGVQPGGWAATETMTTAGVPPGTPASGSSIATVSTFGVDPNDPRSGGMPVIDLTGAPAPPGYRPAGASNNISVPPPQSPPGGWGPTYPATPTTTQPPPTIPSASYPSATPPAFPTQNYPNSQNVSAPYPNGPSAEVASRLTPIPPSNSAVPIQPQPVQSVGVHSNGAIPGPSTEPVAPSTDPNQNLMWRTPGMQ